MPAPSSTPCKPPPCLVPEWLVWSMVVGCLGLAVALIPSKRQLVGRLLEDGDNQRALEVARDTPADPVTAPLSALDSLRVSLTPDFHGPGAVAALAIENAADPAACLDLVHRMEPNLDATQKRSLYRAISRSALAQNNPAMAAQVAADAIGHGFADAELRLSAVQSWRWAGKPDQALKILEQWRTTDPASFTPESTDTEITLSRETGANDHALKLLLSRLDATGPPGSAPPGLLELALTVAANAGRIGEVLPRISLWVDAQPAGKATVAELATAQNPACPIFKHFAGLLARHSEWSGQPGPALDWYLKLAVLGDSFALERANELQKGLNRSQDFMAVLQHIVPVEGQPQYTRLLPTLLADAGDYAAAPAAYDRWLQDHPNDTSALTELGALYSEIPDPPKALAVYEKVAALEPGNLLARKEIADLRLVLKDFAGAFKLYNTLPDAAHDAITLENYSLLAESLADYPAYNRALLIRYHRLHHPSTSDFLELARSYALIDQPDGAITTLSEGLRRLPESRVIRTHLAQSWRNKGNYDEAIRLLAVPSLKDDFMATSLFIEVCCLKEDYQQALAFLGRGIEKKFAFPPDVLLDLGHIYFNNGYMTEADTLYSSVPDEPSLWPLIANARFQRGDLAGAETFQRRYLSSSQVPDPQGWLLMGDILRAGGREAEAQEAYQKSLTLMEEKLHARPVAGVPPAAKTPPTTASNP